MTYLSLIIKNFEKLKKVPKDSNKTGFATYEEYQLQKQQEEEEKKRKQEEEEKKKNEKSSGDLHHHHSRHNKLNCKRCKKAIPWINWEDVSDIKPQLTKKQIKKKMKKIDLALYLLEKEEKKLK